MYFFDTFLSLLFFDDDDDDNTKIYIGFLCNDFLEGKFKIDL